MALLLQRVHPAHKQMFGPRHESWPFDYYWSVYQSEWAFAGEVISGLKRWLAEVRAQRTRRRR